MINIKMIMNELQKAMIEDENLSIIIYFFIKNLIQDFSSNMSPAYIQNLTFSSSNPEYTEPTPYFGISEVQNCTK